MSTTLFPYHPTTGLRLEKTIEFIPAGVPQQIFKEAGKTQFEFTGGSQLNWDASETQQVGDDVYLADSDGTECLLSEAVWSEIEGDSIAIETPALTPQWCVRTPFEINFGSSQAPLVKLCLTLSRGLIQRHLRSR